MKKYILLFAAAIFVFGAAFAQKKGAKKAPKKAALAETIMVEPTTDNVVTCLMTAYLTKHSNLAGAAEMMDIAQNPSKKQMAAINDTCAFLTAGDNRLQAAVWPRANGHTLVGFVYNLTNVKFYDYNPETYTLTLDRAVATPITSILGGDYTITFNTDGFHCSVVRLTGYGSYFNFNGTKFVTAKHDLGQAPTW
ncbi:MAG: hypothetical protein Q4B68_06275 [Bacteroidales bacterium]|nr:hypothetical protein [Bacteroidales bacterium]